MCVSLTGFWLHDCRTSKAENAPHGELSKMHQLSTDSMNEKASHKFLSSAHPQPIGYTLRLEAIVHIGG